MDLAARVGPAGFGEGGWVMVKLPSTSEMDFVVKQRHAFTKLPVYVRHFATLEAIHRYPGEVLGHVAIKLKSHVLGQERDCKSVSVSYPSTWWDAFKERWFPLWAKRRWPVKRTTETLKATLWETYPHCQRIFPEMGESVFLETFDLKRGTQ